MLLKCPLLYIPPPKKKIMNILKSAVMKSVEIREGRSMHMISWVMILYVILCIVMNCIYNKGFNVAAP
jgi:hypothetical protein